MGTVTNPLGNLLEGMVQGYGLAHQIKQQAMQEEAFQRQKAMQEREMQVQDIQHQMMLDQNARPATGGMVEDSADPSIVGPNLQGKYVRKADPSRTVKYKSADGQAKEYELLTPEEQLRRHVQSLGTTTTAEAMAKAQAGEMVRQRFGQDAPEAITSLFPELRGQKVSREELMNLSEKASGLRKPVSLAPGASLVSPVPSPDVARGAAAGGGQGAPSMDTTGDSRVLYQAPPVEDPKTRAARSYYAGILGKDPKKLTPEELAKGVAEWESATMNPLDKQLKQEELKQKPFDLQAKKSTIASQALERQIKSQEIDLAGDADTINMAAQKYLQTGQMPALGMGSSLLRAKIMGRAGDLARENGLSPEQVPALQDSYKAYSKSLSDLETRKNQLEAFESGGAKNLDNFIRLAQKQIDTGSPLANRALRGAARTITGSADQAAADTARMAAYNEISKILSGSLGNAAVSDSARGEAEKLLSGSYTMKQLLDVSKVLRQDMKNRTGAYGEQIKEIRKQMQGLTKPGAAPIAQNDPLGILK